MFSIFVTSMKKLTGILFLLILFSCTPGTKKKNIIEHKSMEVIDLDYAGGFEIFKNKETFLNIKNPWQRASGVEFRYRLVSSKDTLKKDAEYTDIQVPVKKIVCLSTTHIGFIDYLGELNTIEGISGTNYVTNEFLSREIKNSKIKEVGYEENLNIELIYRMKPDVVLAYGVSGSESGFLMKLKELGIPVLFIAEYLEEDPLAKAEWIKVFGALFNKLGLAENKFDSIASNYNNLKKKASSVENKPSVLLGLPWSGTWYISGGESYVAKLITDAGGSYLFKDYKFKDSQPLALETIFTKASTAEFWLNTSTASSLKEIMNEDERFANLPPVKNKKVYNYNRIINEAGGNAYFEQGVIEPDVILADLIRILHPDILPSYELKYYQKLD